MPTEEWWENLEEPLQRPGQMQKHEPRFGYTELVTPAVATCVPGWGPGQWKKKLSLGLAGAVVRPRHGREDGAVTVLGLSGLGSSWCGFVPWYAVPCPVVRVSVVCVRDIVYWVVLEAADRGEGARKRNRRG